MLLNKSRIFTEMEYLERVNIQMSSVFLVQNLRNRRADLHYTKNHHILYSYISDIIPGDYMYYSISKFLKSPYAKNISPADLKDLILLTEVFPFRVTDYVLSELIDWSDYRNDPIYRLTFPQIGMLSGEHLDLLNRVKSPEEKKQIINMIHHQCNPHPSGQRENIPCIGERTFKGIQHKYKETVLFFPAQGQTCHSYCTYCFRWAQFVNMEDIKFKSRNHQNLFDYLAFKRGVTDILFTGGDPLFMPNKTLFSYLNVILEPELNHVKNVRIGTKALSFYPQRFYGEHGEQLIKKLKLMIKRDKNVTIMAHFSHPRELETKHVIKAIKILRENGIVIRTQAPLIKGINDNADTWKEMWNKQVQMGMIPYYMFIERDTGAHHYFSVSLARAYRLFTDAYSKISGLAKTVRGPSMSTNPGKILINGIVELNGELRFSLKFIQARNPDLINKIFYAKFDETSTWIDELEIEPRMEFIGDDNMEYDEASEVA